MRRSLLTLALVVGITATASAGTAGRSVYRKVHGPGSNRIVLRHDGSTEDSCVRLRLVDYSEGRRVYRCSVA